MKLFFNMYLLKSTSVFCVPLHLGRTISTERSRSWLCPSQFTIWWLNINWSHNTCDDNFILQVCHFICRNSFSSITLFKTFWPSICGFSLHRQHHLEFVLFRHLPTDSTVISARRNQISFMVKPSFSLIVLFCVYVFVLSLGKFSLNLSSQKVLKVYVQWLTHKIRLATLFDVCCYSVG